MMTWQVRAVERRLQNIEESEPERDQQSESAAFELIAASVANALGVSKADAEDALLQAGNLEGAVAMLSQGIGVE